MHWRGYGNIFYVILCQLFFIHSPFLQFFCQKLYICRCSADMSSCTAIPVFHQCCKAHDHFTVVRLQLCKQRIFNIQIRTNNDKCRHQTGYERFRINHLINRHHICRRNTGRQRNQLMMSHISPAFYQKNDRSQHINSDHNKTGIRRNSHGIIGNSAGTVLQLWHKQNHYCNAYCQRQYD